MTSKPRPAPKPKTRRPAATATTTGRPLIRMYRQGLGDCFLVRIPRKDQARPYTILIDCGVIPGTENATEIMRRVMADIVATTGGQIDLLIPTHEHADHLSGFLQAKDDFGRLKVGQVWMGWTEDPDDPVAQSLVKERHALVGALRVAERRMAMAGDGDGAEEVASLLSFFGAAGTTKAALEAARAKGPVTYKRPSDAPFTPDGTETKIYVLGPPEKLDFLRRYAPSRAHPETYELDRGLNAGFLDSVGKGLFDDGEGPFDLRYGLPIEGSRGIPFFQAAYWDDPPPGEPPADGDEDLRNDWRRIDAAWLGASPEFALKLDAATNNTSLAIAIELADGGVLLFAADAQVGSWLSWHTLAWDVDGREVTGRDLIERTTVYKGGHHLSHNATLKAKGLELMSRLEVVLAPVDQKMAAKKRWFAMPKASLVADAEKRARDFILRPDRPAPAHPRLTADPDRLWWEIIA